MRKTAIAELHWHCNAAVWGIGRWDQAAGKRHKETAIHTYTYTHNHGSGSLTEGRSCTIVEQLITWITRSEMCKIHGVFEDATRRRYETKSDMRITGAKWTQMQSSKEQITRQKTNDCRVASGNEEAREINEERRGCVMKGSQPTMSFTNWR